MEDEFAFPPIINKYFENSVGFKAHHDCVTEREIREARISNKQLFGGDFTIVFLLNTLDKQGGGEFVLNDMDNLHIQSEVGTLISHRVDFIHSVNPIVKGERYSLVCRTRISNKI